MKKLFFTGILCLFTLYTIAKDKYLLPTGIYNITNSIVIPANSILEGAGRDKTIINWWGYFLNPGTGGNAITLSDNCELRNLTISNKIINSLSGCIGTRNYDGDISFTNALVEFVDCYGLSDSWYVRHTNKCSAIIKYSKFYSKWDINLSAGALHDFTFYNCFFTVDGSNYSIANSGQEANATTILGGNIRLIDCYLKSTGSTNANRGLYTLNNLGFIPNSSIYASGCYIEVGNPGYLISEEIDTTIQTINCSSDSRIALEIFRNNSNIYVSSWLISGNLYKLECSSDLINWFTLFQVEGEDSKFYFTVPSNWPFLFFKLSKI